VKKIALAFLLVCSICACASQAPNPADYTIDVHVTSSWPYYIRLKVVIDGKKYELEGLDNEATLLAPGDYKAKMITLKVKDPHSYDVYKHYEFLFSDKKTRNYNLVGILE
jgi:hypothetical protein